MQVRTYADQDVIIEQNAVGYQFYIIKSGVVACSKEGKHTKNLSKLDYFGHRALITGQPVSRSLTASGPVECWVVSKQQFEDIID